MSPFLSNVWTIKQIKTHIVYFAVCFLISADFFLIVLYVYVLYVLYVLYCMYCIVCQCCMCKKRVTMCLDLLTKYIRRIKPMVVVLRTRIVQRTATAIWLTKGSLACATAPWFLQEKVRSIQFDSYTCMYVCTCMYIVHYSNCWRGKGLMISKRKDIFQSIHIQHNAQ